MRPYESIIMETILVLIAAAVVAMVADQILNHFSEDGKKNRIISWLFPDKAEMDRLYPRTLK